MTAVNIITETDAIHVFCDGAHYLGDGTLGAISSKGQLYPHLNAVACSRGPTLLMDMLGPEIGRKFETFDELVEGIVDLAREVSEREVDTLQFCQIGADFDLFVAGFSIARNRPEAYVVASHDTNVEPWILHRLGPVAIAPYNSELAVLLEAMEPATDILSAGVETMEAQRRIRGQNAGHGPGMAGVGGHCQWIKITRESIQTAVVRRWDDRIGEVLGEAA
ncbi:MAG: hypothetical protein C0458_21810 [Methylobacterium sp.]|nr:hypothetical protein [Methylobacterium sp.]